MHLGDGDGGMGKGMGKGMGDGDASGGKGMGDGGWLFVLRCTKFGKVVETCNPTIGPASNDLKQLFSEQKEYLPAHLLVFCAEELQVSQIQDPCKNLEGLGQVPHHEQSAKLRVRSQYCQQTGNGRAQQRNALEIWVGKFGQPKTRKLIYRLPEIFEISRNQVPKTCAVQVLLVDLESMASCTTPLRPASAPLQETQAD